MNETQVRLLQEQYRAPKRTVTASQLAELAGVREGYSVVNLQYGRLGHMFCDEIGFTPDVRPDGTHRAVWSVGYSTRDRGFLWEMRPEVVEALESLGWVSPEDIRLPEEVSSSGRFIEGAVCRVTINAYERNPTARTQCIAHYGASCVVCGFNFGTVYGKAGEGFIHVHHLRSLAEIGKEYEVHPIADLRPVCANCHAIIHRRNPPYCIEEVQAFLNRNVPLTRLVIA
ncbi:HNH endonuclease [Candidatus Poribacteria bacterium]|nr:HNH endonuclease [Candidatus Poribacteria bacterium]